MNHTCIVKHKKNIQKSFNQSCSSQRTDFRSTLQSREWKVSPVVHLCLFICAISHLALFAIKDQPVTEKHDNIACQTHIIGRMLFLECWHVSNISPPGPASELPLVLFTWDGPVPRFPSLSTNPSLASVEFRTRTVWWSSCKRQYSMYSSISDIKEDRETSLRTALLGMIQH